MEGQLDQHLVEAALAVFATTFGPLELSTQLQTSGRRVLAEWEACALRALQRLAVGEKETLKEQVSGQEQRWALDHGQVLTFTSTYHGRPPRNLGVTEKVVKVKKESDDVFPESDDALPESDASFQTTPMT